MSKACLLQALRGQHYREAFGCGASCRAACSLVAEEIRFPADAKDWRRLNTVHKRLGQSLVIAIRLGTCNWLSGVAALNKDALNTSSLSSSHSVHHRLERAWFLRMPSLPY